MRFLNLCSFFFTRQSWKKLTFFNTKIEADKFSYLLSWNVISTHDPRNCRWCKPSLYRQIGLTVLLLPKEVFQKFNVCYSVISCHEETVHDSVTRINIKSYGFMYFMYSLKHYNGLNGH